MNTTASYNQWCDAVESGDAFMLRCDEGHASLPPQQRCPVCRSAFTSRAPLPDVGRLVTWSEVHVSGESTTSAPYVVAIVEFSDVRVTGRIEGIEESTLECGDELVLERICKSDETSTPIFEPK